MSSQLQQYVSIHKTPVHCPVPELKPDNAKSCTRYMGTYSCKHFTLQHTNKDAVYEQRQQLVCFVLNCMLEKNKQIWICMQTCDHIQSLCDHAYKVLLQIKCARLKTQEEWFHVELLCPHIQTT